MKSSGTSINRDILRLAGPNIISNISIPLLGLVDMTLMGHLPSDAYIGAIALGSLIFNFIYWSLGFLRMGTSGFTAQAFGRKDMPETFNVFSRAAFIASIMGVLLLLLQRPIEILSFAILNGEDEVVSMARSYFRIRIWAAPAALGQFAFLGYFLGMQNARQPLIVLVLTNLINIVFNYVFVMIFHMGADGVALGTVIAQYAGLITALIIMIRKYRNYSRSWSFQLMLQLDKLKEFLSVNKDIFIRTMCLVLVFSFFTASSASADKGSGGDETILAVNSLLMQFFMFFSFLIDGFAHAAEALTGKFIGAREKLSLHSSIKILFAWGLGIGLLFTLLFMLGANPILRLLTNNSEVIANSQEYIPWIIAVPLLSFTAFIWDGIFIGATAGKEMRNAMLISTAIFFPLYFLLQGSIGNHGLWLAFILYMTSRGITMTFMRKPAVYKKAVI